MIRPSWDCAQSVANTPAGIFVFPHEQSAVLAVGDVLLDKSAVLLTTSVLL